MDDEMKRNEFRAAASEAINTAIDDGLLLLCVDKHGEMGVKLTAEGRAFMKFAGRKPKDELLGGDA